MFVLCYVHDAVSGEHEKKNNLLQKLWVEALLDLFGECHMKRNISNRNEFHEDELLSGWS